MVELIEAVETIIGLLKDSSTGIGTTGYEITDDNNSGLTIADNQILVTGILSKEEIKDLFGGAQDFDVIITVNSREVDDSWIGLSGKIWKELVEIGVNVIDKWSAAGSGNKYITADLVRFKAVNAIRKFIKVNTNVPGGTINIWKFKSVNNEENTSIRPTLFKAVIRTEAWMYYNPDAVACATGEQASNGGLENGDFGGWVNDRWDVTDDLLLQVGTYCARGTILSSIFKQGFNILVSCFTVGSTAQFQVFARRDPCAAINDIVTATLVFDNGHTKDIICSNTSNWDLQSFLQTILDEVTAGNIVVTDRFIEIRFVPTTLDYLGYVLIDALSVVAEG